MAIMSIAREKGKFQVHTSLLPLDAEEPEERIFASGDLVVDWFKAVEYLTEVFSRKRVADCRTTFNTKEVDWSDRALRFRKVYIILTQRNWEVISSRPLLTSIWFPMYLPAGEQWSYRDLCQYVNDKMRASKSNSASEISTQ